jgi:hypothetical protein
MFENVADDELDVATVLIGELEAALSQHASAVDGQAKKGRGKRSSDGEVKPSPRTMGQILKGPTDTEPCDDTPTRLCREVLCRHLLSWNETS